MDLTTFLQFFINGIVLGMIYVLLAIGLSIIFGMIGIVNLTHGILYMLGPEPFDPDASDEELAGIWQAFALLKGSKLQQGIVPVKEFKFEQTVVHRVDQNALPAFVKKYVKSESSVREGKR